MAFIWTLYILWWIIFILYQTITLFLSVPVQLGYVQWNNPDCNLTILLQSSIVDGNPRMRTKNRLPRIVPTERTPGMHVLANSNECFGTWAINKWNIDTSSVMNWKLNIKMIFVLIMYIACLWEINKCNYFVLNFN